MDKPAFYEDICRSLSEHDFDVICPDLLEQEAAVASGLPKKK
jgi:dienelactone hydrolase